MKDIVYVYNNIVTILMTSVTVIAVDSKIAFCAELGSGEGDAVIILGILRVLTSAGPLHCDELFL